MPASARKGIPTLAREYCLHILCTSTWQRKATRLRLNMLSTKFAIQYYIEIKYEYKQNYTDWFSIVRCLLYENSRWFELELIFRRLCTRAHKHVIVHKTSMVYVVFRCGLLRTLTCWAGGRWLMLAGVGCSSRACFRETLYISLNSLLQYVLYLLKHHPFHWHSLLDELKQTAPQSIKN